MTPILSLASSMFHMAQVIFGCNMVGYLKTCYVFWLFSLYQIM